MALRRRPPGLRRLLRKRLPGLVALRHAPSEALQHAGHGPDPRRRHARPPAPRPQPRREAAPDPARHPLLPRHPRIPRGPAGLPGPLLVEERLEAQPPRQPGLPRRRLRPQPDQHLGQPEGGPRRHHRRLRRGPLRHLPPQPAGRWLRPPGPPGAAPADLPAAAVRAGAALLPLEDRTPGPRARAGEADRRLVRRALHGVGPPDGEGRPADRNPPEEAPDLRETFRTTHKARLSTLRLDEAARLLRETNNPVGEIALSVGFNAASHFNRCFKERFGTAPQAYRARSAAETPAEGAEKGPEGPN